MMNPLLLALILLFFFLFGYSTRSNAGEGPVKSGAPEAPTGKKAPLLTRQEVELRLKKLAESVPPDPKSLSIGAECYKVAMREKDPGFVICSTCGGKTQISAWQAAEVETADRIVSSLGELPVRLDTQAFCGTCSPGSDHEQVLKLKISYPGEKEIVTPVEIHQLEILSQFLAGSDRYKDRQDNETPMKNHYSKLREILTGTKE